jgi:transposase-like protein
MANFFTDIAPNVIFSKDPTAVIDYYVQHKLLGDVCNCPTCPSSMAMVTRPTTSTKDGFGWRCANQRCPTRRTIRAGSFFERSLITLDKWLYVTYLWSQGTKVNSVERQVQIGERRVGHLWLAQRHPKPSLVDVVGLVTISIELGHVGQLHTSPSSLCCT